MSNTSVVRLLKKINEKKIEPETKKIRINLISLIALILSMLSLYFQFFYEKFELNASLIDSTIKHDTINLKLIYHNKGNQDATILGSEIYFYSNRNMKIEKNHIQFINKNQEPHILSPGKQVFDNFIQKVYFDQKDLLKDSKTSNKDTLRIGLKINYLRDNSLQGEKVTNIGWITLDSINRINYWYINYQKIALDSEEFYVSGYHIKK